MLADKSVNPLKICNFGFWENVKCFLKKTNIKGSVQTTVKKYLDQVICNIGIVELKYLAKPSIIGSITHADKFSIIAFIKKNILRQWTQ